ncbi:MAG: cation transporter, partial [Lachnospiraceae bacterium]|nr:cation transporter [Lachnospiraceae bacterium]
MEDKRRLFEELSVPKALWIMAIPAVASQLITLVYNLADTWFVGRTNNPYMVASCSLVLPVFMITIVISNVFGVGGGTLITRLIGSGQEEEASKVSTACIRMALISAGVYSLLCLVFMTPLLRLLGASDNIFEYARQYMFFVVVLGGVPCILNSTLSSLLRSIGLSSKASFGFSMGGVLNILLDPLFMFVLLPDGKQVMGAAMATLLSNLIGTAYFVATYRKACKDTVLRGLLGEEKLSSNSLASIFGVGIPAATGIFLFDLC